MRNVWRLFVEDVRALFKNPISAIVVMGVLLVPSLYAWFNLLAFWDPDGAIDQIPVAVADMDEGYRSSLLPTKVNAGSEVEQALRENKGFKWVFTTDEDAVDGVRSGTYFAAIVIPKTFTRDLLTVFSDHPTPATIEYYVNQKANAVASELTEQGMNQVQARVGQEFANVVADVALGTTSNLTSFLNGDGIATFGARLKGQLDLIVTEMEEASDSASSFADLAGACSTLLEATADALRQTGEVTDTVGPLLDEAQTGLDEGAEALGSVAGLADRALAGSQTALDDLSSAATSALDGFEGAVPAAQRVLDDTSADVAGLVSAYQEIRSALQGVDPASPAITALDQAILQLQGLEGDLGQASADLGQGAADAKADQEQIQADVARARSAIDGIRQSAQNSIAERARALQDRVAAIKASALALGEQAQSEADALSTTASGLSDQLEDVEGGLEATSKTLGDATDRLSRARDDLDRALASGDLDEVRRIIGSDPAKTAAFLSAPTELVRHDVYPIANNGSAMSPFYLSLAIWIGSIFEVALIETNMDDERRRAVEEATGKPLTPTERYLGRYGIFGFGALCQATILTLGAILFLGIQCEHPWLLILSGWVSALVFSCIIYTLVLSFGRVGEAIVVVGLVAQIAGSGGIFPVALSGPIFEAIYPWLPFSHSMEAFESCIAGIYGNQLAVSLGLLLAFIVPMLVLGLLLRRPAIKFNEFIDHELEESGLIFKE